MTAIKILIFSFLIPSEFKFSFGSLILGPYRVVLLCLAPYLVFKIVSQHHTTQWRFTDALAFAVCLSPMLSFGLNTSLGAALESGGVQTLELIVPYFLIRTHINSHRKRVELAKLLFLLSWILFIVGLPEAVFGRHFVHEIASQIMGVPYTDEVVKRLGIWRAVGPTDHAIILGSLCAITLSLAVVRAAYHPKRWINALVALGGAIISASSAPVLASLAQTIMLTWAFLTRGRRYRWWLLLGAIIAAYITISLISNRDPFRVMFNYLLLNPSTGYARYYMWIYSFEVIHQSTWGLFFGYGYSTDIFQVIENAFWRDQMENTIDSFWLVLMLRFGIIALGLFLLLVVLSLSNSLRYVFSNAERHKRYFMQAWFISAFAMTLIATTVHFWGFMTCMYMIILAVCAGGKSPVRKKRSVAVVPRHPTSWPQERHKRNKALPSPKIDDV